MQFVLPPDYDAKQISVLLSNSKLIESAVRLMMSNFREQVDANAVSGRRCYFYAEFNKDGTYTPLTGLHSNLDVIPAVSRDLAFRRYVSIYNTSLCIPVYVCMVGSKAFQAVVIAIPWKLKDNIDAIAAELDKPGQRHETESERQARKEAEKRT